MKLGEILDLSPHGADVFVGTGPTYPWGGLYGGQIVAQALIAAGRTLDDADGPGSPEPVVHSVRAYFIRRGDQHQPVRYEVDRIRNGRTFSTRRVVARQDGGAILNLEASFQRPEDSPDVETVTLDPDLARPDALTQDSWSPTFVRTVLPDPSPPSDGGHIAAWFKVTEELPEDPLVQAAALAYLSDDPPTDAVIRALPVGAEPEETRWKVIFSASLDHTIWFHRPGRADRWSLHDFRCRTAVGGRGLALGHVLGEDGTHVATVAQEVLVRDTRNR